MSSRAFDKELGELDRAITALGIDYERFFTGDVRLPPTVALRKIEETIRRLSNSEPDKAAERFRFQALQSRFQAVRELWEKRLQARDTGRGPFGKGKAAPPPPQGAPAKPAGGDASGPGSVQGKKRLTFEPLFERYIAARRALGEDVSRVKYEKFEELIRRQADEVRKRTGSTRLVFEIQTVDGKVRLVGRAAPPKGNG